MTIVLVEIINVHLKTFRTMAYCNTKRFHLGSLLSDLDHIDPVMQPLFINSNVC